MVKHNQHVITQQIVELDIPSASDVHKLSQTFAQRFCTHTMPDIEALFDRYSVPGRALRVERIEVDLGDLADSNWQAEFDSKLAAQLADVLKKVTTLEPEQSHDCESDQDNFQQFIYFLRHGRLPDSVASPPSNWHHRWLQETNATQWQALRSELAHNEHMRNRLIYTLDDSVLATVAERLFGLSEVLQIFTLWVPAILANAQQSLWRIQFWQALLDPVSTTDARERGIVIVRRLLKLQARFSIPPVNTREGPSVAAKMPEPWRNWLAAVQADIEKTNSATFSGDIPPATDNESPKQPEPAASSEQSAKRPNDSAPLLSQYCSSVCTNNGSESSNIQQKLPTSNSSQQISNDVNGLRKNNDLMGAREAIHVNGAGCIVLHPFLEELFRSSNLLNGRDFREAASRDKAVRMLSRLTFGEEAMPEYELLLPKLLCGMAWQEPLPPIDLSDEEHVACDQLLDAVVGHWQALQGCSANWLREQFFLRPAKLEAVDEGWRLSVERRAQDVLLDRLPWGLGAISLPWRRGLIYVSWMK